MKTGIFAMHTDLDRGFSGAMAMNQIAAFSGDSNTITLFIPMTDREHVESRLKKLQISAIEDLPRYDLSFDIVPVKAAADFPRDLDILIWQTYRPHHRPLRPARRTSTNITRSFPRFIADTGRSSARKLTDRLAAFDTMAMSLEVDVELCHQIAPQERSRIAAVPRGFSPEWLHPKAKTAVPLFACDASVKPEDDGMKALAPWRALFEELKRREIEFEVIAARKAGGMLGGTTLRPMNVFGFYERFFNPAWFYLACDMRYSAQTKHARQDAAGRPVYLGLYENQVVESQLAGAIPLAIRGQLDERLLADPCASQLDLDLSPGELADKVIALIENFPARSARSRTFAETGFSHAVMRERWLALHGASDAAA